MKNRYEPIHLHTTPTDDDDGIEEPQQGLPPSVVGAHCGNHHDNCSCYSRCYDVVAPVQQRHRERADAEQDCEAY
jgi:hypothetical protein